MSVNSDCNLVIREFPIVIDKLKGWKPRTAAHYQSFVGGLLKLALHATTAVRLAETPTKIGGAEAFDAGSITVIGRAIVEGAGMWKVMFLDSTDQEEAQFLLDVHQLTGLLTRAKQTPLDPESVNKLANEHKQVLEIRNRMKKNPSFSALTQKSQKNALRGRWSPVNKSDLLSKLGAEAEGAKALYSYLSDYAHGGYLSALQISQPADTKRMAEAALIPIAVALSLLIDALASEFGEIQRYVSSNHELGINVSAFVGYARKTSDDLKRLAAGSAS